ncbi:MAG: FAD-dependent oxidoreductase [Desulfosalsimonadaceae bacterium]
MSEEQQEFYHISGRVDGERLESRVLEERIQAAVAAGQRAIEVAAYGQHGIGGRLWGAGDERVFVRVTGHSGQRLGAMGFGNTVIENFGPASDDVGWLNGGATIVVHGNAANGVANAMSRGIVYVGGNIGSRGMTMTKHNPRFDAPQLWVLGSVGDYFAEFMAGGIAVVCGVESRSPENILGHRPFVGMVGGTVFFNGPHGGYSKTDAKILPVSDADWQWLSGNLEKFLGKTNRMDVMARLSVRERWQKITARSPHDQVVRRTRTIGEFRTSVWDRELGSGGLLGDITDMDMSPVPLITTDVLRRYVPVWENRKYLPPCQDACPAGIPVLDRWRLVREGKTDAAMGLALKYTPFPATVCGHLCPNLCMGACTRQSAGMPPVDITVIGKAGAAAKAPDLPEITGGKIAVIGGGAAGISAAWQLRLAGHAPVVFDMADRLGGKISALIPESRIPGDVLETELARVREVIGHVQLQKKLRASDVAQLTAEYDYVVVAAGARKPRMIGVPGIEKAYGASDFLARAKKRGGAGAADSDMVAPGARVVVIGAGNVGCDVAVEAHRLGAASIVLIDVQKPAAFGREKAHAEAAGATFRWPCFTREITDEGVVLTDGEVIGADTVVVSIGDMPETDFLPDTVALENGFVKVDADFRTSDPKIFAVGDIVKPGLLTDSIGAGRRAAAAISKLLRGADAEGGEKDFEMAGKKDIEISEYAGFSEFGWERDGVIDRERVSLEYFDPRFPAIPGDMAQCSADCLSCGTCRDCGICEAVCPQAAIYRDTLPDEGFEYRVMEDRCIGCGFCAGACPCGIWALVENEPLS